MYFKTKLNVLFYKFRELILYGIIGGFSASVDFIIYYILTTTINFHYLISNFISIIAGITISFFLNREFNFKTKNKLIKRLLIFLTFGFLGLIISSLLLYCFIEFFNLSKIMSKILSIVLVVILQFLLNKHITFKIALK